MAQRVSWMIAILLCGGGLFFLFAAIKDWDAFMRQKKVEPIVSIFGRQGARYFYGIIGAILCTLGTLVLLFGLPRF